MHRKNWHPLTTHNVTGLKVEGVTFVGRSRVWTIQLWKTFHAACDNIKIITMFPSNLNGDGIDWYGGGRATVRDSFFRVADDCIALQSADVAREDAVRDACRQGMASRSLLNTPPVALRPMVRATRWSRIRASVQDGPRHCPSHRGLDPGSRL